MQMATAWSELNLANTVGYRRRMPCEVGFAIEPWGNGGRTWTWSHQWGKDGRCLNCRKTVKQVLEPKPITLHEALKGN